MHAVSGSVYPGSWRDPNLIFKEQEDLEEANQPKKPVEKKEKGKKSFFEDGKGAAILNWAR